MKALSFSKMNISSFIVVCCLTVTLTIGCALQANYRVNPDSPAKMSKDEARSAIKQTLATMEKSVWITDIILQEDSFKVQRGGELFTCSLSEVSPEVTKDGDDFGVRLNIPQYRAYILFWKSEGDAKLFVDAVHALKKAD